MMSNREKMEYYEDIRFDNHLKKLPLKYYLDEDKEKVLLFEISELIPRIWSDLDKMTSIDKTNQITSRRAKINSNSKKCTINAAKKVVDEIEVENFSFIDKLEETIYHLLLNLLRGSSEKVERTLNTIDTPKGQLMLAVVSTYALGQEILIKFGEINSSRRLEATIVTKQKFEKAISLFRDLVTNYQEVLFTEKSTITQIAHEEYLYTIADLDEIRKNITFITDRVRERITGQPKLLILDN